VVRFLVLELELRKRKDSQPERLGLGENLKIPESWQAYIRDYRLKRCSVG
jgi:hypothetical protein